MGGAFSVCAGGRGPGLPGAAAPLLLAMATPRAHSAFRGGERRTACFLRSRKMMPSRGPLFRARGEGAGVGPNEAQSLSFLLRYPTAVLTIRALLVAIVGLLQWRRCCVLLQFHFVKYNNPA